MAVCITCSSLQQYNCDTCTCSVSHSCGHTYFLSPPPFSPCSVLLFIFSAIAFVRVSHCFSQVKNGVVILFICLVLGVTIIYCCCFCYHAEWCLWYERFILFPMFIMSALTRGSWRHRRAAMNKQNEEVIRRRLSSTVSEGRTAQYPF